MMLACKLLAKMASNRSRSELSLLQQHKILKRQKCLQNGAWNNCVKSMIKWASITIVFSSRSKFCVLKRSWLSSHRSQHRCVLQSTETNALKYMAST